MSDINERFLPEIQKTYRLTIKHTARSNKRLMVLHSWVRDEIQDRLGGEYEVVSMDVKGSKEVPVKGMYYTKKMDVVVKYDNQLIGVVGCKFVNSNYRKNTNNYFENLLGEVINFSKNDIVFGNFFCITAPVPRIKNGKPEKWENIKGKELKKYFKLKENHGCEHAPECQAFVIVKLDESHSRVERICNKDDLSAFLSQKKIVKLLEMNLEQFFEDFTRRIKEKVDSLNS